MMKMCFCFCQVTYWPLAKMKLDKSSQKAKTKMFIKVRKPSCIILLLNERCPSGLSHHRLTFCRQYLYTFPGFAYKPGSEVEQVIASCQMRTFCAPLLCIRNSMKSENRQSFTAGCDRSHLKPIISGDGLPKEDETSVSCFNPVKIKCRVSSFKYQRVQMSDKSDWTNKPDGLRKETERAWCWSEVSRSVQLFFALLFLLRCVEVVMESLERRQIYKMLRKVLTVDAPVEIEVKLEITFMSTCGRRTRQSPCSE